MQVLVLDVNKESGFDRPFMRSSTRGRCMFVSNDQSF